MTNPERTVPQQSLARIFPGGFPEYWAKLEYKKDLDQIIYTYTPATATTEEIKKTLASGGYGLLALPIAKHFFDRYQYRWFEPYEDDFMAQFKSNTISVIAEVRRKEHLWTDTFRDIKQYLKKLTLKTDTRTSQNYDKTQNQSGKTINQGNESSNWQDQKQGNVKNIPAFSNVDLTSGLFGGFSRQQQLSTQTQEQGQGSRSANRQNTTTKQNHSNKEYMRASKDSNVSITSQDSYELAQILKSRLLGNFEFTVIRLSDYYPLFDKLFLKLFGASVVPIYDPETGRRRWVSQVEYEEEVAEQEGRTTRPLEGNEWDLSLSYLERITIYRNKTDKELGKMPPTSNRRPRIARRLEVLEGLVKAEEKLANEEIIWATLAEFDDYCNTYIIGYRKFISIMRAQLASQLFYQGTGEKVPQGLYLLLGPPGIGKSYICQELAKATKRGFHSIDMNGKRNGSIIFGSNIENPGAEIGEIVKAVGIVTQDPFAFVAFDEYEKSFDAAKSAVGDVTDMTKNKFFKDELVDFPYNLENITFFATGNHEWQVEGFIFSRFTRVEIEVLTWRERMEILRRLLFGFREMKGKIQGLEKVLTQKGRMSETIREYLRNLDDERLLKRFLTENWGIRQSKNNALLLVKRLNALFAEQKELPNDPVNYEWGFTYSTEKGELCSELHQQLTRPRNCQCWDSGKVEGWEENM